jgi:hypothetical protein
MADADPVRGVGVGRRRRTSAVWHRPAPPIVLSPEETAATAAVQNIVADAQSLDPENPGAS